MDHAGGTATVLRVHADHLGTPQSMTDDLGTVVWERHQRPFGETASETGTPTNDRRFPGQLFDAESGYHYNYFRDYDPSIGRYVTSDPIGLRGGWNTYVYVKANPMAYFDTNGLERKPGKTPPGNWPLPPREVAGKKPKWNPDGYWEGKKKRRLTWDDRSHGAGIDRGEGEQGGHWDDETSDNRWDQEGNPLPGSEEFDSQQMQDFCPLTPEEQFGAGVVIIVGGVIVFCILAPEVCALIALGAAAGAAAQ